MADIRSLISQIPMEPGYVPAPPQPDLTTIQRLLSIPQVARALGQNIAVGAASLPYGIYKGFGDPAAGEAAMSQFQQEYGYVPTDPAAQRQLQGLGEFLQSLETEYKIPPMISPSQLPSRALTRSAAMQANTGAARLTNEAADRLVQMITQNPEATAPAVLEAAGQMLPISRMISPEIAARVMPETRAVMDSKPVVAYHATGKDVRELDPSMASGKSAETGTFFSSNPYTASTYAAGESPNVIPSYLDFKRPMVVDAKGANWNRINKKAGVELPDSRKKTLGAVFGDELRYVDDYASTDDLARYARQQGYDGLIVNNVVDHGPAGRFATDEALEPSTIYVAFDKQQIRSALSDPQMAGLLDQPAQSVVDNPLSVELSALKTRLDELNNQFATGTAPPSAVREHGAVMKRYQELQNELYPRPQTTPMVQEPDVQQGLLPEQSLQEISKAVAQRDIVQTDNFKNWFGDWQADPTMASKVVDESGSPKIVFHGTQRPDRIGTQFRKSRATSGPMSFFTDDPEIASGYATGKRDTSLAYEDTNYANWFKKKEGRSRLNLDQVGARMSSQERQEVLDKLRRVGQDDQGNIVMGEPLVSDQTFDFMLRDPREAGGNPLKLANKLWLESGTLYGREEDFSKVLKAIGVKGFEEDFPTSTYPAVYPVYLDIKNPLNTMQIDQGTLDALEAASKRQRRPRAMGGADQWDKRMRDPQQWMSQLKEDLAEGKNSMVWTSIPDWVTNTLKKQGFDGIEDVGGKSFGSPHTVWIPFEENQIKSATGNVGTFSKESKNILRSAAPAVGAGLLGAGMMQEEEQF